MEGKGQECLLGYFHGYYQDYVVLRAPIPSFMLFCNCLGMFAFSFLPGVLKIMWSWFLLTFLNLNNNKKGIQREIGWLDNSSYMFIYLSLHNNICENDIESKNKREGRPYEEPRCEFSISQVQKSSEKEETQNKGRLDVSNATLMPQPWGLAK